MAIEALEGVTDEELFNQANADEAPAETVVEPADEPAEQDEQPRDEAGRFAAVAADEPVTAIATDPPASAPVDDNVGRVPSFRLKEEAAARRQLENDLAQERADKALLRQRLEALERPAPKVEQAKVEKPDPLLDPEGYAKSVRDEIREEMLADRRETSLQMAHKTYKTEFEEAYAAAQKNLDPVLKMKMQTSRDPGETLIEWHREQKTRAEVGNDITAFRQREQERLLSDPAFLAKAVEKARGVAQTPTQPGAPRQAAPVNLPPSLTRATSAAANTAADDDVTDEGLWRHANA